MSVTGWSVARNALFRRRLVLGIGTISLVLGSATVVAQAQGDAKKGEYLAKAGGCKACHTENKKDAVPYAGGRELKTPFGTFYGPNITPDPDAGIGRWSEADFKRAMRLGERPDGAHYFPSFPYPSFTGITDSDLRDLWAYLRTVAPSKRANRAHDLSFPYSVRALVAGWKLQYFKPGPFVGDPARPAAVNRGAYLVQALSHCGECHTPRNALGGPIRDRFLAGTKKLPDGAGGAPNLTPTRLKKLSDGELKYFLESGLYPDGDVTAESMGEVVRNTTSQLTPEDLAAMIAYLRTLPPLPDEPK